MFHSPLGVCAHRVARRYGASVLVVLASLGTAHAQGRLDPVTVTGTREPLALSRDSGDIVVIDATQIRDSDAASVEDLLRRYSGLQVVRNGGPGQSAGYLVRGASTNGTLILVDGIRIGSASLGQAELEALDLAQIERIEVLRGPVSSLYGADGVGGVVQIFTRRGEGPLRMAAHAALGGYGSRRGDASVSGARPGVDYAVMLGRESSDGVSALRPGDAFGLYNPDRDGFSRNTGNLRLGVTPAAGHRLGVSFLETRLDAQYDSAEYDAAFNADPSPDFRNRLTTRIAAVDYRGELGRGWTTSVRIARSVDDLASGGTTTSRFITRRDQATWQNALRLGAGQRVVVAYERLDERAAGDVFPDGISRHNNAVVVGYAGGVAGHDLQADLRHDDNSAYGGETTGRLGWSHELQPGLRLRALAGTTFRAPTFNDLYYPGYGVATVRPENGRSIEIGIAWRAGESSASATLYRNRVRDLIVFEPDPTQTLCPPGYFGCATNTGRARLQGATLQAAQRWGGLDLRAGVDLLDAVDVDSGQRLARRAAHQETASVDYAGGPWSAGASMQVVGARPDAGVVLGAYTLVDLRAAWRFESRWRLELALRNAFDRRVEPVRDYQGLGRQAWLGLRFDSAGL
ncbi:MAG: TonB-dependent receptor [Caldimonas sp.]